MRPLTMPWVIFFLACTRFAGAQPMEIAAAGKINLGPACNVMLVSSKEIPAQQLLLTESTRWRAGKRVVLAFGVTPEILWLHCKVINHTTETNWAIISQYNFEKQITLFLVENGKVMDQPASYGKSFWQRNTAFPLLMKSGMQREFLIRYEADLAKVVFFQVMPELMYHTQEKKEGAFFLAFTLVLSFFVLLNLFLAFSLRSIIPLLYCFTIIAYYFYQTIQFGFGPVLFYPTQVAFNGNMVSISAGLGILFYQLFFQRLLSFQQIVPRWNLAINVLHFINFGYILAAAMGVFSIGLLQKLGRLFFFAATFLVFSAGWTVYRKQFRPALYSIYGFLIMWVCQSFYFSVMSGFVDFGSYFVKAVLPVGQLVEYLFFFATLSLRLKDKGQINRLREIAEVEEISRDLERNAKLRLPEDRATATVAELEKVFQQEKIFSDEDLSLERLANMLHVTRHELSDLLNKRFGVTFYEFVNRYRVQEAAKILSIDAESKILDVAMSVGFNSKSTFNKEFKRIIGKSPREFRA